MSPIAQKIIAALKERGPMRSKEIAKHLPHTEGSVRIAVYALLQQNRIGKISRGLFCYGEGKAMLRDPFLITASSKHDRAGVDIDAVHYR